MKKFTIEKAVEEMKNTVKVFSDGYGTWKVKANIGIRSSGEYVEDYFTTNDEEWKTGIFDGKKYNDYANSDQAKADCEERGEDFDKWYEFVTNDRANDDNYESTESRDERAARILVESWTNPGCEPRNVFWNWLHGVFFIVDDDELSFASDHPELIDSLTMDYGRAFSNAYSNREE